MLYAYPYLSPHDKASFAYFTLSKRIPLIVQRVMRDYPAVTLPISKLLQEIQQNKVIQPFVYAWEDQKEWEPFFHAYGHYRWEDLPFFPLEAYLYRRIQDLGVERMGVDWDPFAKIKQKDLQDHLPAMVETWQKRKAMGENVLADLMALALGGNQADLSQVQQADLPDAFGAIASSRILVDDRERALEILNQSKTKRVHYVLDNAGVELFHDLLLIQGLLETGQVDQVIVHAKRHPTFVSDVTLADYAQMREALQEPLPDLIQDLTDWEQAGGLQWEHAWFWNQPYGFRHWREQIKENYQPTDLLITKGDANYRRILDDRRLPHGLPTSVVDYLPCPLLAIRTLKSEIQIGLSIEQIEHIPQQDPQWLTEGRWGVFQLFGG